MARSVLALAGFAAAAACGSAIAAVNGGPSPGSLLGGAGVLAPGGEVRYVALSNDQRTVVESVSARTGRVLRSAWVDGTFGIPLVAFDGSTGGLTRDGKTLVLAPPTGAPSGTSSFVFVNTRTLKARTTVTLRGSFSFDALSPNGKTLYVIQYLPSSGAIDYRVRAYDVAAGRLLPGAIADRREASQAMTGSPVTRATSADGRWVYTLYSKPGTPFVHALDAARRSAVCIDLPWSGSQDGIWKTRLHLSQNGRWLAVRRADGGRTILVDTKKFSARGS